jgi:DnaJ-class molecular chaperone
MARSFRYIRRQVKLSDQVSNLLNSKIDDIKTVKKRGMPFYKDGMSSGDLNIEFEVEFPKPRSLKED